MSPSTDRPPERPARQRRVPRASRTRARGRLRFVARAAVPLVGCLTLILSGVTAGATAASPSVSPATGGGGVPVLPGFTSFDPAAVGYEQSEVLLSGTASAYEMTASANNDGKYSAVVTSTAPYTTRAVVMRPVDRHRFNGTVIVEWLNVSGGSDAGADWMLGHNELIREGFAWVGVSAQRVGVNALQSTAPPTGDAARYAGLSHPGDDYSYDIFSQAGQAIRANAPTMLGGLKPEHLIAIGESQSAGRLVTYIDAVHPLVHVYDGFLVHSRMAGPPIRDDVGVPVLVLQTETDVSFSGGTARQPDTSTYRLWEAAGTSHYDFYGLSLQSKDTGDGQSGAALLAAMQHPTNQPSPNFTCGAPINTGPAHYIVVDRSQYKLYYMEHGILKRVFDCVLGRPSLPTPLGHFRIYAKDPHMSGPYGPRRMRYLGEYAIHGTDEPWLLGRFPRNYSHGCTRLSNTHILWLFARVPVGTPVWNVP